MTFEYLSLTAQFVVSVCLKSLFFDQNHEIQGVKFPGSLATAFEHFQNQGLGHVFWSFLIIPFEKNNNFESKSGRGISKVMCK